MRLIPSSAGAGAASASGAPVVGGAAKPGNMLLCDGRYGRGGGRRDRWDGVKEMKQVVEKQKIRG